MTDTILLVIKERKWKKWLFLSSPEVVTVSLGVDLSCWKPTMDIDIACRWANKFCLGSENLIWPTMNMPDSLSSNCT